MASLLNQDPSVQPDFVNGQTHTPAPFVITEDISSGALTVTLDDTDLPYGRAREMSAFRSGGKTEIAQGGIYNPGSNRVVLQMMSNKLNKLTIRGAFRDRIRAGAQKQNPNDSEPNHARAMRDLIERIRDRANPLKITWDGQERTGVIEEANFDEESPHDIAYEITFFVAIAPTGQDAISSSPTDPTPSLEDLRSYMAEQHALQMAALNDLLIDAVVTAGISNGMGYIAYAVETLGTATVALERMVFKTPQHALAQVNAVISLATAVQTQVQNMRQTYLDAQRANSAMQKPSADSFASWWSWQSSTELELDQMMDAMRQIRLQALAQVRLATRLYRVQDGDTLEDIALQTLGSRARASELGIRPDQLVPGSYIRVPK